MGISIVITAFNEEKNIKACLESIGELAGEIIVIDNSSTDKTAHIAEKYTSHIYQRENDPKNIDLAKNFGFEKATKDWILSLDADERVTPELREEIKQAISTTNFTAYKIPRKNIIFNKWIKHSLWHPDFQTRLFQRGKAKYTHATVHKQLSVEGTVGELKSHLIHENYQSLSQYLSKMDIYTTSEAEDMVKRGVTFVKTDVIAKPSSDFLKTYFLQEGYKDGYHGFVLSCLQAVYAFLVVTKVWEKKGFDEQDESFLEDALSVWQKFQKEFSYWVLTTSINKSKGIRSFPAKVRRKLVRRKLQ